MTCATVHLDTFAITFHETREAADAVAAADDRNFVLGNQADLAVLGGPTLVEIFNSAAREINDLTSAGLVEVKRFPTKEAATKRTLKNLFDLMEARKAQEPKQEAPKETPKARKERAKATKKDAAHVVSSHGFRQADYIKFGRMTKGINQKPNMKLMACREGTKQAVLIDLLCRAGGATLDELHAAMNEPPFKPWTLSSTKTALGWDVSSVKGYGIRTEFQNGEQLAAGGRNLHAELLNWDVKEGKAKEGYDPKVVVAVYHAVFPKGVTGPLPHISNAKLDAEA